MRDHVQQTQAVQSPLHENEVVQTALSPDMLQTRDDVKAASRDVIPQVKVPGFRDEFTHDVTPVPSVSNQVQSAVENFVSPQRPDNVYSLVKESPATGSHYALPVLNLGRIHENYQTTVMMKSEQEIINCEKNTRELLDLSKQIQQIAGEDNGKQKLSPELKAILVRMKLITDEIEELDSKKAKMIDSKISGELSAEKMKMEIAAMKPQKIMALIKIIHEFMQAAVKYKRQEDSTVTQNTRR